MGSKFEREMDRQWQVAMNEVHMKAQLDSEKAIKEAREAARAK